MFVQKLCLCVIQNEPNRNSRFQCIFSANHFSKSPKLSLFLRKNEINQNKQLSGAISNCLLVIVWVYRQTAKQLNHLILKLGYARCQKKKKTKQNTIAKISVEQLSSHVQTPLCLFVLTPGCILPLRSLQRKFVFCQSSVVVMSPSTSHVSTGD